MEPDNAQSVGTELTADTRADEFTVPVRVNSTSTPADKPVVSNHAIDTGFVPANPSRTQTLPPDYADTDVLNQGPLLDQVPLDGSADNVPPEPKKRPSRTRVLGVGLLAFGLFAGLLLGIRIELGKSNAQNASLITPSAKLQRQTMSLPPLSEQLGANSSKVSASSSVRVNGSLVLAGTVQPSSPVAGQLFYNQNVHQMQYYDGTGIVALQGGTTTNIYNSTTTGGNTYITNNASNGASISGTAGTLAMFGSDRTSLTDSLISQSGNALTTPAITLQDNNAQGLSILTADTSGASGGLTLQTGSSSTTGSGDITIDTGSGTINGTVDFDATFESGVDDLVCGDTCTAATSSTVAHSGAYSLSATSIGNTGLSVSTAEPFTLAAIPGHSYYVSAWIRTGNGTAPSVFNGSVFFSGDQYDDPVGSCPYGDCPFGQGTATSNGWTQISGVVAAPLGAKYLSLGFIIANNANGSVYYLDDVTLTDMSNSVGSSVNIGTTNAQTITIGNGNQIGSTSITAGGSGINLTTTTGIINIDSSANDVAVSGNHVILSGAQGTGNGVEVKPQGDSSTAFSVQNASGNTTLLNVDTANNAISLGTGAGSSFGDTHVGSFDGSAAGDGYMHAYKFTTIAANTLTSLSVYLGISQDSAPNNNYQLAIYSDNSNSPSSYLGSTAVGSLSGDGWYSLPLAAPVSVAASTNYWLVYWENGSSNDLAYSPNAGGEDFDSSFATTWQSGTDNGMPTTFPAGTETSGAEFSIYGTFASGGPALTENEFGTLTQSGAALFQDPTDSTQAFQIKDSIGNTLLSADTADMLITVSGNLTVSGNITVDGHIVTGGSTPGIAAGAAATSCGSGGSPSVTISGDDTSGTITVTTGSGGTCTAGDLADVIFANAFGDTPHVVLNPDNHASQALGEYSSSATTGFTLDIANTPATTTTYKWDYWVAQ